MPDAVGRSSEALDEQIHQLELKLEDLEESELAREAAAHRTKADLAGQNQPGSERRQPVRRPLPDHLQREEIIHAPDEICPACGGTHFSKLGEDTNKVLEKIPARVKVIRHIRPKLSCRACETIIHAPESDLPIEKGRPGAGLVANVVVSKYLDGLPLYRQSAILAREGIEIERATLADWVGHAAWWLLPLAQFIGVDDGRTHHMDGDELAPKKGKSHDFTDLSAIRSCPNYRKETIFQKKSK